MLTYYRSCPGLDCQDYVSSELIRNRLCRHINLLRLMSTNTQQNRARVPVLNYSPSAQVRKAQIQSEWNASAWEISQYIPTGAAVAVVLRL